MFDEIIETNYANYVPPAMCIPVAVEIPGQSQRISLSAMLDSGADITVLNGERFSHALVKVPKGMPVGDLSTYHLSLYVFGTEYNPKAGIAVCTENWPFGKESALIGRDILNKWKLSIDGCKTIPTFVISMCPNGQPTAAQHD